MYELPHKLPNDLRLRKLGNFNKFTEMLGFDGEYPVGHPKANKMMFSCKKLQKISCRTFQRKIYFP